MTTRSLRLAGQDGPEREVGNTYFFVVPSGCWSYSESSSQIRRYHDVPSRLTWKETPRTKIIFTDTHSQVVFLVYIGT